MDVATTPGAREAQLSEFIERLVAELAPLQLRLNEAVWLANVTGAAEHEAESAAPGRPDPEPVFAPRALRVPQGGRGRGRRGRSAACAPADAADQRATAPIRSRSERIERMVQLEKSLESRFNSFRAELDGERGHRQPAARGAARFRRLGRAAAGVGGVQADRRRGRGRPARSWCGCATRRRASSGFANYYSMMLELDELDERELFALLDELERGHARRCSRRYKARPRRAARRPLRHRARGRCGRGTTPIRSSRRRRRAEVDLDPLFANAVARGADRALLRRGRLRHPRPARSAPTCTRSPARASTRSACRVDRGDDIRVLCNVRPNEYWMGTMLHEFGHAVYDQHVDRALPWLLRGAGAHRSPPRRARCCSAACRKNAAWLARCAGHARRPRRDAAAEAARARGARPAAGADALVPGDVPHGARALPRSRRRTSTRCGGTWSSASSWCGGPTAGSAPDWASKIHFSVAPVYYHNYLLGEMMASQLQRHLLRQRAGRRRRTWERYVSSPEVGTFLRAKLYARGRRSTGASTLRSATGDAARGRDAFVDDLGGRD